METHLVDWFAATADGQEAQDILRACVHCGFCTATCPTYQLLGDENDGPRGRIYLMKEVMEGGAATRQTQVHLDRCLSCRSCETTCPSGVRYGRLLDIGRALVESQVSRPPAEKLKRSLLREGVSRRAVFEPGVRLGRAVAPLLPQALRQKLQPGRDGGAWPATGHARRVLLLDGCVQPSTLPNVDAATARVLDRLGVEAVVAQRSGCCGALRQHLDDPGGALELARRNVEAWSAELDQGAEAIVLNASGCAVMVREYGHLLRNDAVWAQKAARVSAAARDLSEWLPQQLSALQMPGLMAAGQRIAFHAPCTLQHGLGVRGVVEELIRAMGAQSLAVADAHLCCGSAGSHSLLQPEISTALRELKLKALEQFSPDLILSANVGCLMHLQEAARVPVMHWIEWLDEMLAAAGAPEISAPHGSEHDPGGRLA